MGNPVSSTRLINYNPILNNIKLTLNWIHFQLGYFIYLTMPKIASVDCYTYIHAFVESLAFNAVGEVFIFNGSTILQYGLPHLIFQLTRIQ